MTKIRVGIIGTGWGQLQIESFRRARAFDVVALCDLDAARLSEIAQRYKIDQTFADYHDLVAHPDIDVVSIASPPDLHRPMAQAAVAARKHVFIEKPAALQIDDLIALQKSAEANCIVHAIDFEMRFLPALAYCKELIDEQYLGQLLRVDVTMGIDRPWGEHGHWAADAARGGGILNELGAHFIDTLLWWFGAVEAVLSAARTHFPIVQVPVLDEKHKETILVKRPVTSDDSFWSILQFKRGGEALLNFVTGSRHDIGWTISAYGTAGTLVVQSGQLLGKRDGDREIALLPIPKRLELGDNPKDPLMWSMARLAENMASKIRDDADAKPFPDFRDDLAVVRVVDAIHRASDARTWIRVT
jgi:predicted dehydrogenase